MGIYGNIFLEKMILNEPDIYYNKEKFDSGEINICFITGHSGSGKSTMANSMETNKIEKYELDDVISNKLTFTMENLKEYGDLIYSFFKGPGKKFFYIKEDIDSGKVKEYEGNYEEDLIKEFIKYSISYAKSNKNKKFVIEGIWLYNFIKPEELKEYAVYIKGTSILISTMRAAKRDSKNDFPNKDQKIERTKAYLNRMKKMFIKNSVGNSGSIINSEKLIQNYRDYFTKLIKK